jgi:hypothetical protein
MKYFAFSWTHFDCKECQVNRILCFLLRGKDFDFKDVEHPSTSNVPKGETPTVVRLHFWASGPDDKFILCKGEGFKETQTKEQLNVETICDPRPQKKWFPINTTVNHS